MIFERRRIARGRDGSVTLRFPEAERQLLRSLPDQLRTLIEEEDESAFRLSPPAYENDPEASGAFHDLASSEVRAGQLGALAVLERTAEATTLSEAELDGWLRALNLLRLVLGTQLDVHEEIDDEIGEDDPRAPRLALYHYLSVLQEQAVAAAAEALP